MGWSRRLKAAWTVGTTPSRRALSITWRTRSGRERALPARLFSANSTSIRSVPAETREADTLTRAMPGPGTGMGTSAMVVLPLRMFWRSCFMNDDSSGSSVRVYLKKLHVGKEKSHHEYHE